MGNETETAIAKPYSIIDEVKLTLQKSQKAGEIDLPEHYSVNNALKSAYLALQETYTKDKKPVLTTCTKASICNALLDMVIQGLNPSKKQCYFIAYGLKLLCQRSYFGTMSVTKEVADATEIWAEVVYKDDTFEITMAKGQKTIKTHEQKLENINSDAITGAYCVIEFKDSPTYTEIMTMDQIHKSWAKSQADIGLPKAVHSLFPEEMCKRTVINRACKKFINSSADKNLLKHIHRTDEERTEEEVAEEIEKNANKDILEITEPEATEEQPVETPKEMRDPSSIKTINQLMQDCKDDFSMDDKQVCAELGVSSRDEITDTPANCYVRILAHYIRKEVTTAEVYGEQDGPGF